MRHLWVILFLLVVQTAWTQGDSLSLRQQEDSILLLVYNLPPLKQLLQEAQKRSPLVQSQRALITIKENELKKIKNDWSKILSFRGSVGYGNSIMGINQSNLSVGIASNVNTVLFNVGVILNLSPEYWLNRKHEVNILEAQVNYQEAITNEAVLTITEKITDAYIELDYYKNIYIKASASFESNRSTLQIAKKKFLEGEIDIATYNDMLLKNMKLDLEIEGYKQNLKKAYYALDRILSKN